MSVLSLLFHDVYVADPAESGFGGPAADRYKLPVAAFERQLAGLARVRQDQPLLVDERTGPDACRGRFVVTVDDGGVSFLTEIAGRLEARGWRAHCFVTTGCIGRPGFLDAPQVRELHRRGHAIGSHSVSHPTRFAALTRPRMVSEWADSRRALEDILGAPVMVASVPGGYYSTAVAAAAADAGFRVLFTSEPDTRVRVVSTCLVFGRFIVRQSSDAGLSARLGTLQTRALVREWMVWNGKKVAKTLLGAAYPRLGSAVAARCR